MFYKYFNSHNQTENCVEGLQKQITELRDYFLKHGKGKSIRKQEFQTKLNEFYNVLNSMQFQRFYQKEKDIAPLVNELQDNCEQSAQQNTKFKVKKIYSFGEEKNKEVVHSIISALKGKCETLQGYVDKYSKECDSLREELAQEKVNGYQVQTLNNINATFNDCIVNLQLEIQNQLNHCKLLEKQKLNLIKESNEFKEELRLKSQEIQKLNEKFNKNFTQQSLRDMSLENENENLQSHIFELAHQNSYLRKSQEMEKVLQQRIVELITENSHLQQETEVLKANNKEDTEQFKKSFTQQSQSNALLIVKDSRLEQENAQYKKEKAMFQKLINQLKQEINQVKKELVKKELVKLNSKKATERLKRQITQQLQVNTQLEEENCQCKEENHSHMKELLNGKSKIELMQMQIMDLMNQNQYLERELETASYEIVQLQNQFIQQKQAIVDYVFKINKLEEENCKCKEQQTIQKEINEKLLQEKVNIWKTFMKQKNSPKTDQVRTQNSESPTLKIQSNQRPQRSQKYSLRNFKKSIMDLGKTGVKVSQILGSIEIQQQLQQSGFIRERKLSQQLQQISVFKTEFKQSQQSRQSRLLTVQGNNSQPRHSLPPTKLKQSFKGPGQPVKNKMSIVIPQTLQHQGQKTGELLNLPQSARSQRVQRSQTLQTQKRGETRIINQNKALNTDKQQQKQQKLVVKVQNKTHRRRKTDTSQFKVSLNKSQVIQSQKVQKVKPNKPQLTQSSTQQSKSKN